jgi:hypothetical protein
MREEVAEACFGRAFEVFLYRYDLGICSVARVTHLGRSVFSAYILDGIGGGDLLVSVDVKRVANSFWDGQTEVQCGTSWDGAETVNDSPRFVEGNLTVWSTGGCL